MALRCLLACSDAGAAQLISETLVELGMEAELFAVPQAMEQIATQVFHLLIVDWDQPDAAFLLNAARERKAAERPMALAVVSNDASVSQVLQAGANSILRKPVQANQAKDTLTTAYGLLCARHEAPARVAAAASGGSAVITPSGADRETATAASEKMLRAGDFLQSGATPSAHYVTESEVPKSVDQAAASQIDPLKALEPMAAAVETQNTAPPSLPPEPDEPRGLSWYLKKRLAAAEPPPAASANPELLGFSETPSYSHPSSGPDTSDAPPEAHSPKTPEHEQGAEAALFAYISGETPEEKQSKPRRSFSKIAIAAALAAGLTVAYFTVPQSAWRPRLQSMFGRSTRAAHNWLNPQPVTTTPAPTSHENFGRAGDEYKLPVAETIPDATTDPSQIRVVPVIDPTAKPNANNGAGQTAATSMAAKDVPDSPPTNASQPEQAQVQGNQNPTSESSQTPQTVPPSQTGAGQPDSGSAQIPAQSLPSPVQTEMPVPTATTPAAPAPLVPQRNPQVHSTSAGTNSAIPSSLKSQMASTTPEASGNKPVEAALPSIEPVDLPEIVARSLLLDQPDPVYPENAKGQHGTVILQLLIGRDGTVQDTKFQQGSLVFARAATDAVRQWRFKPYTLNTHPVSVRTVLTLNFKPAS